MTTPLDIKRWIEEGLKNSRVETSGDGRHFEALVISEEFANKSLLERHRLVYQVLGDKMKSQIHALSLRTLTAAEYNNKKV